MHAMSACSAALTCLTSARLEQQGSSGETECSHLGAQGGMQAQAWLVSGSDHCSSGCLCLQAAAADAASSRGRVGALQGALGQHACLHRRPPTPAEPQDGCACRQQQQTQPAQVGASEPSWVCWAWAAWASSQSPHAVTPSPRLAAQALGVLATAAPLPAATARAAMAPAHQVKLPLPVTSQTACMGLCSCCSSRFEAPHGSHNQRAASNVQH